MGGTAYQFACQNDLHWSPKLKVCIDKTIAKCNEKTSVEKNDNERDSLCPAGFKGFLPDETDCRRYISCSENGGFFMKCQSGLVWSSKKNSCEWPSEENPGC